ncbi:MAG: LpxI family protein [Candidatus Melainabacteria bacterium]|nr:LpxI family protein [Candidatus Melainabacteria bacterium]
MHKNGKRLAIIAGNGNLTTLLAKSASSQGFNTYGLAITDEAKHNLDGICDTVNKFAPGQISKMIDFVKKELINQVVFIGKVPKLDLLRNIHKLDWLAIKNLGRLKNLHDDSIHEGIVSFLKEHNIEILPQTLFLKELFLEKQILSKRKPSLEERIDIEYGFDIAKKIGSLDIGQTVVVKNKMIIAIEAIEGTDEAIKRGCKLANGEAVVVKVAKPNQDKRFDIPTIGTQTIETLAKCGGGILAFESSKTIAIDIEKVKEVADKYNICLLSI